MLFTTFIYANEEKITEIRFGIYGVLNLKNNEILENKNFYKDNNLAGEYKVIKRSKNIYLIKRIFGVLEKGCYVNKKEKIKKIRINKEKEKQNVLVNKKKDLEENINIDEYNFRRYKKLYLSSDDLTVEKIGGLIRMNFLIGKLQKNSDYYVKLLGKDIIKKNEELFKKIVKDRMYLCTIDDVYGCVSKENNSLYFKTLMDKTIERFKNKIYVLFYLEKK